MLLWVYFRLTFLTHFKTLNWDFIWITNNKLSNNEVFSRAELAARIWTKRGVLRHGLSNMSTHLTLDIFLSWQQKEEAVSECAAQAGVDNYREKGKGGASVWGRRNTLSSAALELN